MVVFSPVENQKGVNAKQSLGVRVERTSGSQGSSRKTFRVNALSFGSTGLYFWEDSSDSGCVDMQCEI